MMDAAKRWAAVLGLSLYGIAMPAQVSAERARSRDVNRCARFSQIVDDKQRSVTFTLNNGCAMPLSCKVGWRVACTGAAEPELTQEQARIAAGASEGFFASVSHCEGGWSIRAVRWSCDPITDPAP